MRLLYLGLGGFRSFKHEQEFRPVDLAPGLYHLTGHNEIEPRLEGNGIGKSTLLEALVWLLFARTSQGLKAGEIVNWSGEAECFVVAIFEHGGARIALYRSQSPNQLLIDRSVGSDVTQPGDDIDWKPIDQAALDKVLGLSLESFTSAVFFTQRLFANSFLDQTPGARMDMYSDVMSLAIWETASERATKTGRDLEKDRATQQTAVDTLKGEIKQAREVSWLEEANTWDLQTLHDIDVWMSKSREIEQTKTNLTTRKWAAEEGLGKQKRHVLVLRSDLGKIKKQVTADREAMYAAQSVAAAYNTEAKRLSMIVEELSSLGTGSCPRCRQPLSAKHVQKEIAAMAAPLREAQETGYKAKEDVRAASHKHGVSAQAEFAIDRDLQEQFEKEQAIQRTLDGILLELKSADTTRADIEAKLKQLREAKNPYREKQASIGRVIAQKEIALGAAQSTLDETNRLIAACTYWAKGFKDIRLSRIQESLDQFNLEANEALYQLGLTDWALRFDVERETGKGSVQRGFHAFVESPYNAKPVRFEVWSGGESQRLRLAATMGLSNLISSRLGLDSNIEMWDEPTSWLTAGGISDLMDALRDRAARQKKIILLADHRVFDQGRFAGTITLKKDKHGSQFV